MRVEMKSSRAYCRLLELMEKYPDEDFSSLVYAITAHTMIYATIMQTTPETIEKNFDAIKSYYTPVNKKMEENNALLKKACVLGKSISINIDAVEVNPNVSEK